MTRYIDADKFIDFLKKEKETAITIGDGIRAYETQKRIDLVASQPQVDAVPKSEVEDLKRYIILNEDIAIKCKQENGEQNEEYWKGKISAFRQIRAYIEVELKKKYTEGEK